MRKIIFGSSCDPFGRHHVALLKKLIEMLPEFGNSKLVLSVSGSVGRKDKAYKVSDADRYAMVLESLEDYGLLGHNQLEVNLADMKSGRFTPSYLLCKEFEREGYEPILALGSDVIPDIPLDWYLGGEVLKRRILVLPRAGCPVKEVTYAGKKFCKVSKPCSTPVFLENYYILSSQGGDNFSSTLIRERARAGNDFSQLVSPSVEKHIKSHGLYGYGQGGDLKTRLGGLLARRSGF